jgi:hypothetical protein
MRKGHLEVSCSHQSGRAPLARAKGSWGERERDTGSAWRERHWVSMWRERETETERERQTETERERETETQTERERERDRDTDRDRERERATKREIETERERENCVFSYLYLLQDLGGDLLTGEFIWRCVEL